MFNHDAAIPVDFALAVHAVLHNNANQGHWFRILLETDPIPWIKSIYESNNFSWNDQEEAWWKQQFENGK